MNINEIKNYVRDIPDFPKKGIMFKDSMPLFGNREALQATVDAFVAEYKGKGITKVLGVEARGFLLATPVALAIGAGVVPVRKKGKLPYKTVSATYDLEYGTDTLQMHEDAIAPGEKVLIIDDLLATGGTCGAVSDLVKQLKGNVAGMAFIIELGFLKGREKLKNFPVFSLIKY